MKRTHSFHESLSNGESSEAVLDGWLSSLPEVREVLKVPVVEQKLGLGDRRAILADGDVRTVEFKSDRQGHRTGRAFIETISVDGSGSAGWAFTCKADWLVYYTVGDGRGRVLLPDHLKTAVHGWTRHYEVKTATNPSYHSYGLLVPLEELDRLAIEVFTWPKEQ